MISWLFENSRELLFAATPDGRIALANPAWKAFLGWEPATLAGRRLHDMVHPEDAVEFAAAADLLTPGTTNTGFVRLAHANGGWRWSELRADFLHEGMVVGSVRDASDSRARNAELEDSRRARAMLSAAAGIGTWIYDPITEKLSWSQELLQLTGYEPHEVDSRDKFVAILDPERATEIRAALSEGVQLGRPAIVEHRVRTKAGGWVTLRSSFQTEPTRRGLHRLVGIAQNVSELAAGRDATQLIEGAPFAVAMLDSELRYRVVSPQWVEVFGLSDRPHLGLALTEVFPGMPDALLRTCQLALAGQAFSREEDSFIDSRGREQTIRWEMRPWRHADGGIGGILIYLDDISTAVRARREAQTNSRRLKIALAAADAGVYEVDHIDKTFWASPELRRMIGEPTDFDAVRRLEFPRFHPDDLPHVRQAFLDIQKGLAPANEGFEARILTQTGEERWTRLYHHITRDGSGRWIKAVGLVQDIDARKRQELALIEAERAAQSGAEAKAAFLANMSHEIRTPMNGVLGVLHLLKSEDLSDEGRKLLNEALSCGQMLAELLNDVIDFSKIEAGRLELQFEAVDPRELINGVISLLTPQAAGKGLSLDVDVDPNVGWIWSDPVRLRQALFNLIGNAVKFTLHGGVAVACRAIAHETGPRLRFEIADTGVGVPEAAQSRLFERFDQGDASTTRKFGGSGLGLAITKRLAEIMGGEVGFTSQEGVGSTFWIEVAAEPAEAAGPVVEAVEGVLEGLHILVVEDNATNRLIARKMLEQLGASVETVDDGAAGVEAAEWGMYDLILMDVQMPGMDGLEATRRIRALGDSAARTPIVALTANVLAHQQQEYREAGMDGVVGKPISPQALLVEIARLSREAEPLPEPTSNAA